MILPGIYASQISGHLFTASGVYESIMTATVTSGGTASPITFSSIPQTYSHLQLRIFSQMVNASTYSGTIQMKINSGPTSSDRTHQLYGNGSSAAAYSGTTGGDIAWIPYSGSTNVFGTAIVDILDYTNINKNRTIRTLTGWDGNASGHGEIVLASVLFTGTTAISSITLQSSGGENFSAGTVFALYGIKD